MATKRTLAFLCLLAVFAHSCQVVQTKNCSTQLVDDLKANLKVAVECNINPEQKAGLLVHMRSLTQMLHTNQLQECKGAEPVNCTQPEVPQNGGLACATVAQKRFCKPLCNHGYDFAFLRRSRVFEECSASTGFKWSTQYIGGNKLAVCSESNLQVSGVKTAYFAEDADCLNTKRRGQRNSSILQDFVTELKKHSGVDEVQSSCLLCG
ncbi:uncharacterized protein si:ch1073-126c3.2 [Corythoichthys intestinalis]|uniref:uncharacterized protein si:ch1073-126c3.2 n=1 Tax=Corythoichthys intestinalis TaxID=161448 RepID=UPI0025A5C47C|nr:uncharacterized protein si:ch1073-126c3.2 [Corythoichthys intestinalis]